MTTLPARPPKPRATRAQLLRKLASVKGEPYAYDFLFTDIEVDLRIYAAEDQQAATQWAALFDLPEATPDNQSRESSVRPGQWVHDWSSRGTWRGWSIRVWHWRYEPAPIPAGASTVVMEQLDAELAGSDQPPEVWACPEPGCMVHIADGPAGLDGPTTAEMIAEHQDEHAREREVTA